ncbi:MAG: DUF389 domain-containing protein [Chloroflexota bacterium]
MTLNEPPILPTDPQPPAPDSAARRRRARRAQMIPDAQGRAEVMASLAKRAYPTVEFFIFAVLGGAVLGLGYLLDSPAVLLFGILLAPLMTPWVGMTLALVTGSLRFFLETLVALLISVMLVFLSGLMAGLAARAFLPLTLNNAHMAVWLWLPGLAALGLGAILLVISFVRSEDKPFLPSVMVAYSFLAPISAAGFGLGSGVPGLWPTGAWVFLVHLALATLLGLAAFLVFGFRPSRLGWLTSGGALLALGALLAFLMLPNLQPVLRPAATYTPTLTSTLPPTARIIVAATSTASPKPTRTPRVQTATPSRLPITPTETPAPTETASVTPTVAPTPVYARISSDTGGGVNLRKAPNGEYIATLDNGSVVEVLPEVQEVSGVMWAHVIATKNGRRLEGWILQSVLTTATPVPNWQPTDTSIPTETVEATTAP